MRGALGFSVLRFWLFFRSVFRFLLQKTSVFRFWWSLRFADFSFFSIWFSVFVKNTSGFSVLVPDVVFHIIFSLVQGRDMEGRVGGGGRECQKKNEMSQIQPATYVVSCFKQTSRR